MLNSCIRYTIRFVAHPPAASDKPTAVAAQNTQSNNILNKKKENKRADVELMHTYDERKGDPTAMLGSTGRRLGVFCIKGVHCFLIHGCC